MCSSLVAEIPVPLQLQKVIMSIVLPTQTAVTSGGVLYTGQSFCHHQSLTQTRIQAGSNINGAFQNKTDDCKSAF